MPRILLVAISVLAGILPVSVLALGLGEIDLQSGLNQPFRAEIPVTSSADDEVAGLRVSLAPADTFERYGLLQAGFLLDFKFAVITEGRRHYIRISSPNPVVEPFVTMLLEVRWPQGRLLREYTVLLDPPVFDTPVAAPARPAPTPPARPAPRPVQRPAPAAGPAPQARPVAPSAPPGSFGPVQRNDTLWSIANRTRPDASITINQMMLAIFAANPEAFEGNINRLRAGAILRIPDTSAAAQTGRREAFAEVQRQNEQWRGAAPQAETARLRLVPPGDRDAQAQAPGLGPAGAGAADETIQDLEARVAELEMAVADRERLLDVKDQELAALQDQLAQLRERELAELVAEGEAAPAEPAEAEVPTPGEPAAETTEPDQAEQAAPAPPVRTVPPVVTTQPEEPSFIGQLIGSPWLYGGLVLALLAGLFIARRRRTEEPAGTWEGLGGGEGMAVESPSATSGLSAPVRQTEETFVVEESHPQETDSLDVSAGGTQEIEVDRSADRELPLEKTLSSDTAINLDRSDALAEAEFHSAYGLYDQAADLLNSALEAEPERLDLRRKLIEVYFSWDNRGGFQKAAQEYHDRIGEGDQFWNKVLVMGKQLCPDEALFAAAPATGAAGGEMDFALGDEDSSSVDFALGDESEGDVDLDLSAIRPLPEDAGLDFDLGDALGIDEEDASPTEHQEVGDSPTMETPTVEAEGLGSTTMETPTVEAPGLEPPTMETPTIESPMTDMRERDTTSDTAALDLDELGLDLSEFEDASSDVEDDASVLGDSVAGLESTAEVEQLRGEVPDEDAVDELLEESETTAERRRLDADRQAPDMDALSQALAKSTAGSESSDTAEQPKPEVDETAEQPGPGSVAAVGDQDAGVDLDVGADLVEEQSPTETIDKPTRGREGPTMTEVGTKLDLARAYIDMGDPEGARSILGEVIEEGDQPQRQEAQRLLDTLSS